MSMMGKRNFIDFRVIIVLIILIIVKSVSIDYYNNVILNELKLLGTIEVVKLVAMLMKSVYLLDSLYVYFIKRLIENNKIKVVKLDKNRFFNSVIELM